MFQLTRFVVVIFLCFLIGLQCYHAARAAYPDRPIRLIVPYPPGGPTDLIARYLNEGLAKQLGQSVVVDNRGGAASVIGAEIAARAPHDGYTLFVATVTTLAVNPVLLSKLSYDPERDFLPISMLALQPYVLTTHPQVPANTVTQLISYAKANPGRLSFASAGTGAGAHLAGELFKSMANIDVVHIPYKGTGPAIIDLLSGQVAYMFGGISIVQPHALSGKLRMLAVSSARRSFSLPDLPTVAEGGVIGFGTNSWNALVAPRGTSSDIIRLLNTAVNNVFTQAHLKEHLKRQGIDADPGTPQQLAAHIQSELLRFKLLIKKINLKLDQI